jgi:phosphoglycolate phosphatase
LKYFDFVAAATFDATRNSKDKVIAYALESLDIKDKSEVVMIGDRHHDIDGAKDNGIDSVGVLWGFGSREELETAGATYIAESVQEILKYV